MQEFPFLIALAAVVGAFSFGIVKALTRAYLRSLEIRQRIAMIEKGLVPAPETDPRGFERVLNHAERQGWTSSAARHRRAGITLTGVGIGLMVLIAFAAEAPSIGIGVGGFIAILGGAFFLNSLFELRQQPPSQPEQTPRGAAGPDQPPSMT